MANLRPMGYQEDYYRGNGYVLLPFLLPVGGPVGMMAGAVAAVLDEEAWKPQKRSMHLLRAASSSSGASRKSSCTSLPYAQHPEKSEGN